MPTLHLTGPLGTSLSVETTDDTLLSTLRKYGKNGWSSGEIPAGGLVLPHCMAGTFDWSLIGARPYTNSDGEQAVMHRGHSYKRRDFEAKTTGVKMPACIKYSRGAKPTDPPHLKEGDEGGVQYVTLIMFRGTGKALSQYEVPSRAPPSPPNSARNPPRARRAPPPPPRRPAPSTSLSSKAPSSSRTRAALNSSKRPPSTPAGDSAPPAASRKRSAGTTPPSPAASSTPPNCGPTKRTARQAQREQPHLRCADHAAPRRVLCRPRHGPHPH